MHEDEDKQELLSNGLPCECLEAVAPLTIWFSLFSKTFKEGIGLESEVEVGHLPPQLQQAVLTEVRSYATMVDLRLKPLLRSGRDVDYRTALGLYSECRVVPMDQIQFS